MTEDAQLGVDESLGLVVGPGTGEEGGFADEVPGAEDVDDLFTSIGVGTGYLDLSGVHDYQLRDIGPGSVDLFSRIQGHRAGEPGDLHLLGARQAIEERHTRDAEIF